jgi:hypothetical protein
MNETKKIVESEVNGDEAQIEIEENVNKNDRYENDKYKIDANDNAINDNDTNDKAISDNDTNDNNTHNNDKNNNNIQNNDIYDNYVNDNFVNKNETYESSKFYDNRMRAKTGANARDGQSDIYEKFDKNEIEAYVHRLLAEIPDSARKRELQLEIIMNLSEKAADLTARGMSKEEAVKKTIDDFGDIGDLRAELADSARSEKAMKDSPALAFSVWGAALITALMMFINFAYSPRTIWFVFPLFGVAWWPMSVYFHWLRSKTGRPVSFQYSICGFTLITCLMLFINFSYSPRTIWFVYPVFGLIWWPMAALFSSRRRDIKRGYKYDE